VKKNRPKIKKRFKIESRGWEPGDLVKIKSSTWSGRPQDGMGVVVKEISSSEVGLFPYAIVYDMNQKKMKQFYLYDLELISART
jgi:hypothetical protein